MLVEIIGSLIQLEVPENCEEKGEDINLPGYMLCFKRVDMCPDEDCLKIKMTGNTVLNSRN